MTLALFLRWVNLNISKTWGMRTVKHLPSAFTEVETTMNYRDIKFRVYTGEELGSRMFYLNEYESQLEDVFLSLISPGDLIYDVGANLGVYSLLAASRGASVVAFEPSRKIRHYLSLNIELNSMEKNIRVIDRAVADHTGTIDFFETRDGNWGVGRIFSFSGSVKPSKKSYQVKSTTLDKFSELHEIPNLIKMDIEGAEWLALKGASKLLYMNDAPIFLVEFHSGELKHFGSSITDCLALFRQNKFLCYRPKIYMGEGHKWYILAKDKIKNYSGLELIEWR